ncbi:MAG TPA: histidine phosphatase family protein [Noviherbaspirillum sp.]|nr:histidine phosphatase family protein [Noviherbaspirillum sp.]
MRHIGFGFLLFLLSLAVYAEDAVWDQLRAGGYVLLMRHAQTVAGIGDPPGYTLEDCKTQRNLSEEGRAQARRTGAAFRVRRIVLTEVRSSAWCRCVDTARLAFGNSTVWPPLNSFFDAPERKDAQTAEVLALARSVRPPQNLMLVTHQVNITALTGESVASGEIFVAKRAETPGERLVVVGRLKVR